LGGEGGKKRKQENPCGLNVEERSKVRKEGNGVGRSKFVGNGRGSSRKEKFSHMDIRLKRGGGKAGKEKGVRVPKGGPFVGWYRGWPSKG